MTEAVAATPEPFTGFEVYVEGLVKGKPAVRPYLRGGKPRVWRPTNDADWQDRIALAVRPFVPSAPFTGAIEVCLLAWFRRPNDHFGSKAKVPFLRVGSPSWRIGKPDADNIAKCVLDALNHCGIWADDEQVVALRVRKRYVDEGMVPGMLLTVRPAPER